MIFGCPGKLMGVFVIHGKVLQLLAFYIAHQCYARSCDVVLSAISTETTMLIRSDYTRW